MFEIPQIFPETIYNFTNNDVRGIIRKKKKNPSKELSIVEISRFVFHDAYANRMDARHVNGNGFNNYFYNVSEYTTTLGPSRLAGLQLPFHTTPWHRVLGCPVHEPAIHALRAWNCGYALETRKIYNTHYFSNKYLSFPFYAQSIGVKWWME